MACHTVNMPFMALDLRDPTSVEAETSRPQQGQLPEVVDHRLRVPGQRPAAARQVVWYDGGKRPPEELLDGQQRRGQRLLDRRRQGQALLARRLRRRSISIIGGVEEPKVEFPQSPGHFEEWVRAIKGGEPAMSNFPDYAGPLTETVLLGNLAVWAAKEADSPARRSSGTPRSSKRPTRPN